MLARLESSDPRIADAASRALRDAALQAAREAALHTELDDLDVAASTGVVRVRDGVDVWFCWEAAKDRTWNAAVSGAIDIDYSIFCGAIDGAVLSADGWDRGTAEEQTRLREAAIAAGLREE
ncbi:hypothetical protein [Nannocystis exedens]|uniref:hypothetical protein n=1 Tax=Nannocystis exedens TaxID=54 RepID=UPI000BBA02C6|nr:hypothetical protein [Nannocystis exedens]